MKSLRDRDYIQDSKGVIYKVIGNNHDDFVTGYIRYYPDKNGYLNFNGNKYCRNNFVYNSFKLVPSQEFVKFSDRLGTVVTQVPSSDVVEIFDAKKKLQEIISSRTSDPVLHKLKHLIKIFEEKGINSSDLGVTASILVGVNNEKSDIDLVTDNPNIFNELHKLIYSNSDFISYLEPSLGQQLYERRVQSMGTIDFNALMKQEGRKLQALFNGTHFNIQPVRPLGFTSVIDLTRFYYMGEVELIVEIAEDEEGIFSPAVYDILVKDVIRSTIPIPDNPHLSIKRMVSFIGVYSACFRVGDKVYIRGKICKQVNGNSDFAVILDPWDNQQRNAARILLG